VSESSQLQRGSGVWFVVVLAAATVGALLVWLVPQSGGSDTGPRTTITYELVPPTGQQVTSADLDATVETLRQRLLAAGVGSPVVTVVAPDRVRVELPGAVDVTAIGPLLSATGKLEFVWLPPDVYGTVDSAGTRPVPQDGAAIDPSLPAQFTGADLDRTRISAEQSPGTGAWVVSFAFEDQAAGEFEIWSGQHVNEYFAIVLDGKVVSAPYIKSAITGGQGEISGSFTEQSAKDLATVLKTGQLPLPLQQIAIEGPGQTSAPASP
jgi:protein-export membrane protein SecD